VSAQERLDLNISTAFVELAVTSANMWGKEGQVLLEKDRGSFAPYRIRNRTGSPLFVWSDDDASRDSKDSSAIKIANDQTVDWRFDDWKTMREASKLVCSSGAIFTLPL
jgi:vacuolar protein sorting-associated protein 13A/C